MMDLEGQLAEAVEALTREGVPHALCGGLALAVHGRPRATLDIDFLVQPSEIPRAMAALASAGFTLRAGPIPLGANTPFPQTVHRATKVIGQSHLTVDVLEVSPSYLPAWDGRVVVKWQGRDLSVVSRAGLIDMKTKSTRLKDKADIEALNEPQA